MPKKSKGAGLSRKTSAAKWMTEKRKLDEDSAERDRSRAREYKATKRQDSDFKKRQRADQAARRSVRHSKSRESSRQRELYIKEKEAKKKQVDADIQEKLEDRAEINSIWVNAKEEGQDAQFWTNNFLVFEAGRNFYKTLDAGAKYERCIVCQEAYPFVPLGPRSKKCKRCSKNNIFAKNNNLTPEETPEALKDLTQVEQAAIAQICPYVQIWKRGSSQATRGHCINFYQDVHDFVTKLPPHPQDLPFLYLKNPRESVTDKYFLVRRDKIVVALQYLKLNNPYYKDIIISEGNLNAYEISEDGILQNMKQVDPVSYRIPDEGPTASGPAESEEAEEIHGETSTTVDLPPQYRDAMDLFRNALMNPEQEDERETTDQSEEREESNMDVILENEERAIHQELGLDESFHPSQVEEEEAIQWPTRGQIASEFDEGFWARAFPTLFPRNITREEDGTGCSSGYEHRRETGKENTPGPVNVERLSNHKFPLYR